MSRATLRSVVENDVLAERAGTRVVDETGWLDMMGYEGYNLSINHYNRSKTSATRYGERKRYFGAISRRTRMMCCST
jgi:hypothetical protein